VHVQLQAPRMADTRVAVPLYQQFLSTAKPRLPYAPAQFLARESLDCGDWHGPEGG